MSALQNKQKTRKRILPFVTEYRPSVPNLKNILMKKWHLIENQPVLREIFKDPPILSYRKGRSLKDILVRAKLWRSAIQISTNGSRVWPVSFTCHHCDYVLTEPRPKGQKIKQQIYNIKTYNECKEKAKNTQLISYEKRFNAIHVKEYIMI